MINNGILRIQTAPVFEPLLQDAQYKGAFGGRSSAKSHFFAELTIEDAILHPGIRTVCVREVQKSLRESVQLLLCDKIQALGIGSLFDIQSDRIITPGSGMIVFNGMQDHTAESIKSLAGFRRAYVEEAQTLTERSLELLLPTIREPGSQVWFSWNPRTASDPVDQMLRGPNIPENTVVVRTNWRDNPWFSAESEQKRQYDYKHNPQRYAHIWEGEYEPQAVGALWDRETINRNRRKEAPEMSRILVSVDPCISSEPGSDEAGIIIGGLGIDDRGYVLADYSCRGKPKEWAERAIDAYDMYEADAIVAEVNQGGEMVANTIHSIRPGLKVIDAWAGKRKGARAEPISALYGLDRISHVGAFPELEAQMCLITAGKAGKDSYQGVGSPDRADAMVHLFTQLFPKMTRRPTTNQQMPTRTNNLYRPHRPHG